MPSSPPGGADGGLTPDFERESVFPNTWIFGGCGESFAYTGWSWGDAVRVRAEYLVEGEVCEISLSQLDLVVVERGGVSDVGWCD